MSATGFTSVMVKASMPSLRIKGKATEETVYIKDRSDCEGDLALAGPHVGEERASLPCCRKRCLLRPSSVRLSMVGVRMPPA